MTGHSEKLSAYIDGELTEAEAREIEEMVASDPALQAELDALMAADAAAMTEFEKMLEEPVPLEMAIAIKRAPEAPAVADAPPRRLPVWSAAAASVALLVIGGVGGYLAGTQQGTAVATVPAWLGDIADYHAVYSTQTRHLVEVPAADSDHISTWLTNTVGATVTIPDLADFGLTFQGGRLLVATGKPVAQLMYTDTDGVVIALCLIQTETPATSFQTTTTGGFEMVSWGGVDANFVVVGPEGYSELQEIAKNASERV